MTGFPKNFPEDSLGSGAHNKTNCNRRNNADVGGTSCDGAVRKRRCATRRWCQHPGVRDLDGPDGLRKVKDT